MAERNEDPRVPTPGIAGNDAVTGTVSGAEWLDKPMVVDEKSLPSKDDMERFNVPVDPAVTAERRAKAAAKEARTRAAYGGAPSLDDTTPPWVDRGEEAPEEWSPSKRPWWKSGFLAAAVILISAAFVLSMTRLPFGDDPDPEIVGGPDNSEIVEAINTNDSLRDGDMKFEGRVIPLEPGQTVEASGSIIKPSGKFLIVELQVNNLGSSTLNFDPLAQSVVTGVGRRYGPNVKAQWFGGDGTSVTPVGPGQSIKARLTFDIPTEEVPDTIWLHEKSGSAGTFTRL